MVGSIINYVINRFISPAVFVDITEFGETISFSPSLQKLQLFFYRDIITHTRVHTDFLDNCDITGQAVLQAYARLKCKLRECGFKR